MSGPVITGGTAEIEPHPERSIEERLRELELAVFGNSRQRVPGLINLMPELAEQVKAIRADVGLLKDNKQFIISLVAQLATFLAAIAALIVALRGGA